MEAEIHIGERRIDVKQLADCRKHTKDHLANIAQEVHRLRSDQDEAGLEFKHRRTTYLCMTYICTAPN